MLGFAQVHGGQANNCVWRTEQLKVPMVTNADTDVKIGPYVSFSSRIINSFNSHLKTGMLPKQVVGDLKTRSILPTSELLT